MTVRELKELLAPMNDDHIVVLSRDAEGNGYSPLASAGAGNYESETTYMGQFDDGDGAERNAVALWPTN